MVVAVAWAVYRIVAHRPQLRPARAVALYAIGSIAAFWSIDRIVAIVS